MSNLSWILACVSAVCVSATCIAGEAPAAKYRLVETVEIDTVPSWFPVGFCLLTEGEQQYAAYYNAKHQMVVARRRLGEREWLKVELPSKVGWDSHNYITMALDKAGCIHLSGNMHCVPLIYFRTRRPGDIATFERAAMTGRDELRCTYPRFLEDANGELLFMYRSGGSGNGSRFYNRYDATGKTWGRFLGGPLFDGGGKCNAYPHGPARGPDGLFHTVWVWRDTPDCATNHHLSYARSRDLEHWQTAGGKPVSLPLTLDQPELCIDPIPAGGGIINGCQKLAFDSDNRPVIAYHKADANGHMQIFVTRFQDKQWKRHPITAWEKAVPFSGRGAMPFIGIKVGDLRKVEPGMFSIGWRHRDYGSGRIVLDEATLQPIERKVAIVPEHPAGLSRPTIAFEGMGVKFASDKGRPSSPDTKYLLRWETLGANHDRPRKPPLPPPSVLKLLELRRAAASPR